MANNRHQTTKKEESRTSRNVWDVVNSPFVLLVFSSVVLGLFSFAYQEYSTYRKGRDDDRERLVRIITEVQFRTEALQDIGDADRFSYTAMFSAHGALVGESGNADPEGTLVGDFHAIYPDFGQRSLRSLLWEAQTIEQKTDKSATDNTYIEATKTLLSIWNGHTKILEKVQRGSSDSIWQFDEQESRKQFQDATAKVKTFQKPAALHNR